MLIPAVSYQGAKQRIAPAICARFDCSDCPLFYDLCCGTGSVSIELVNRGTYAPRQIVMVDSGPWGLFWNRIGTGGFSLSQFKELIARVPKDPTEIKGFLQRLSQEPSNVYSFLLLQAGAFGGKAVRFDPRDLNRWAPSTFRDYWRPTATSRRRSPVNPMMPMPETLLDRVTVLVEGMRGVTGINARVEDVIPLPDNALVYIDPPYLGTTGYGDTLDVAEYVSQLTARCYVSEGRALSPNAVCLSRGRDKGGISGNRRMPNEEWLSGFNVVSHDCLRINPTYFEMAKRRSCTA